MGNDVTVNQYDDGGFGGYTDESASGAQSEQGILAGTIRVKFTNSAAWVTNDDEAMPDKEYVAAKVLRSVVKWPAEKGRPPLETIVLKPKERFPDIEALNNQCPKTEWRKDLNGNLVGPYQIQRIVGLLDLDTMDRYSWPTSTTGGTIAIGDLVDRTEWMRRYRGQGVYPVVLLRHKHMNTQFGGRERPHFEIVRWIELGGEALPAPETTALPAPAVITNPQPASAAPKQPEPIKQRARRGAKAVEEPSLKEELSDSIPF